MAALRAGPHAPPLRAQELAAEPDAAAWAQICAWVPGTGHCRNRDCSVDCIFRPQRMAETRRVTAWRRLRRMFARRKVR